MDAFSEIVLASRSPRRHDLLRSAGVPFICRPVMADEVEWAGGPDQTATVNSEMKAVAARRLYPDRVIVAADTVVFLDRLLSKPADLNDARRMLRLLSGRTHTVHTAVTVVVPSRAESETRVAVSRAAMREFSRATIEEYLGLVDPLDKAGGYGIQDYGELLIRGIEGSLTNIIGLPLELLAELFTLFSETEVYSARLWALAERLAAAWPPVVIGDKGEHKDAS